MSPSKEILAFFANELRRLIQREPRSKDELKAWYDAVEEFRKKVKTLDHDTLPHFVWHYLDDADIGLKDPAYKASQDKRIETIISALERGDVPDYWQA